MRELRKHWRLAAILVAVQVLTSTVPLVVWFTYGPRLDDGWLVAIADRSSPLLVMCWLWLLAPTLIATGAYWVSESRDRFCLEVWRHASYRDWLARRVAYLAALPALAFGVGLAPWLVVRHPVDAAGALSVAGLLVLYAWALSLLLVGLTFAGLPPTLALLAALLAHAVDLSLEVAGMQGPLHFFLLGEGGGAFSALATVALCAACLFLLFRITSVASLARREGDPV
ncbi:MAG: hypothetical protein Q7W30_05020 [Coriobacteriia bacterium]|nr:hypothetical protein [Coriobacteriia bacterium]